MRRSLGTSLPDGDPVSVTTMGTSLPDARPASVTTTGASLPGAGPASVTSLGPSLPDGEPELHADAATRIKLARRMKTIHPVHERIAAIVAWNLKIGSLKQRT